MARPFRLHAVARLRESQRDALRARLGEAIQAASTLEDRQADLESELAGLRAAQRAALGVGEVDAASVLDAGRYELLLRSQQRAVADDQRQVEQEVERRRGDLAAAERELRALELLRERAEAAERKADQRRAQRRMDDLAAQAVVRRRAND
ncbi:MAG: flagellar export protein FliJ [Planctomycetota bacterium]